MTIRFTHQGRPVSSGDIHGCDSDFLLDLFRQMLRIRRIEEAVEADYHNDRMATPIHLVIGQEATSVGVCAALNIGDHLYATHRTHGNYLAKGGDLNAMFAEFHCRTNGCCGSRGGSMHLLDKSVGYEGGSAIVGGSVPMAAGGALAAKMQGSNRVTVGFLGDAATEEGAIWESLNFAVLKRLPLLLVCENNFYSVCTPRQSRQPEGMAIHDKARAFGAWAVQVDGTNVMAVYNAAREAVERIRSGQGPAFIESVAYRWRGHGGSYENPKGYRDDAERLAWEAICPVETFARVLTAAGLLDDARRQTMEEAFATEIAQAFEHARSSPAPGPEELMTHVYDERMTAC